MKSRTSRQARFALRVAMLRNGKSVTAIAKEVGHDIAVVSKAINHGQYPRVLAKIKKALHVA